MSHNRRADVATTTATPTCPSQRVFEAAVRSGDRLELERLLEGRHGKFNVNLYDDDGQTALHQVCDVSDCGVKPSFKHPHSTVKQHPLTFTSRRSTALPPSQGQAVQLAAYPLRWYTKLVKLYLLRDPVNYPTAILLITYTIITRTRSEADVGGSPALIKLLRWCARLATHWSDIRRD